ncbi:hypothetical protein L9F63_002237, partial [Diploptera punctata]
LFCYSINKVSLLLYKLVFGTKGKMVRYSSFASGVRVILYGFQHCFTFYFTF